MISKNAFGSLLYFTRKNKDNLRTREELKDAMMRKEDILGKGWKAVLPLEFNDLPQFNYNSSSFINMFESSLVDIVLLIFLNVIFFISAHLSFLKRPVK